MYTKDHNDLLSKLLHYRDKKRSQLVSTIQAFA